jgi:hypothetical protein
VWGTDCWTDSVGTAQADIAPRHDFDDTPPVQPSEEIRRIVERWTKAIAECDAQTVLERLSELPGTLIIGTDPAEWWRGDEAHAVWGRQIEELGSFPIVADEIEA